MLLQFTDYLITSNSTIALEFACFGKKAILGGDAPYYYKDLFFKPKNKTEYFNYLKNLKKKYFILNEKKSNLARKLLFLLEHATNINLPESKLFQILLQIRKLIMKKVILIKLMNILEKTLKI